MSSTPMSSFDIAGGSVRGCDHERLGRNNQARYAVGVASPAAVDAASRLLAAPRGVYVVRGRTVHMLTLDRG
jgi:hypothetical protein